jgi:hypothetical protein
MSCHSENFVVNANATNPINKSTNPVPTYDKKFKKLSTDIKSTFFPMEIPISLR